ncbi:MAG TPA: amidohydrolase family protein [Opitutaceae bacterium]|nr:amidohydrolase family protein [Opitutaceae bacterium]
MTAAVIDCHVHLYSPEINRDPAGWAAAAGEPHWARLCTRRRKDGRPVQSFPDADGLIAALDAAGIERAILLGWYWQRPENCAGQNRFFAECLRRHPGRLSACAALQPAAGAAAVREEMRRARDEGLCGLGELSPHAQGYGIGERGFAEALELAADFGWPVNLHVTDPAGRSYPGSVPTPLEDFLELARRHARTSFVLAHWGGLLPVRLPAVELPANLHFDTSASPLIYPGGVWSEMLGAAGARRVCFGSDFPLNLYPRLEAEPEIARFAGEARREVPEAAAGLVLAENARRMFRLP